MRFAHILVLVLGLCAGFRAQAPEPVIVPKQGSVEDVYLARDDGKGKAGDVAEQFSATDIPIHCIVMLAKDGPVAVKMNLLAIKVAGVKPESRVVSAAYNTKQGQDRVYFTGRPDGRWVPGTYRIDIYVEGKMERSVTFDVKGGPAPAAANQFAPPKPKSIPRKKNQ